jgi:hypothetical protein
MLLIPKGHLRGMLQYPPHSESHFKGWKKIKYDNTVTWNLLTMLTWREVHFFIQTA